MSHTLVTGANSFVAAHIIQALIAENHLVTGAVRRAAAGNALLKEHPEWKGELDIVEIEDYGSQGSWDSLFKRKEFDYIVHVASPMVGGSATGLSYEDWLKPSVDGNLALLRSAKEYAPSLKHISITGSINALTMGDDLATREITDDSWNSITKDFAASSNNEFVYYCSVKKEAELAVWDFVKTEKPTFGVTVFLPALIFGPPIQVTSIKSLNFSVDAFYSLWDGRNKTIPQTMFPSYIDARDLAVAHIKAFTRPAAKNKRFLIGGMPFTYTDMVKAMKDLIREGQLPKAVGEKLAEEGTADLATPIPKIDAGPGNTALEMKFKSLEETVKDMALKILEIKKRDVEG